MAVLLLLFHERLCGPVADVDLTLRVFAFVAGNQHYSDALGYGERSEQIVRAWRQLCTAGKRRTGLTRQRQRETI